MRNEIGCEDDWLGAVDVSKRFVQWNGKERKLFVFTSTSVVHHMKHWSSRKCWHNDGCVVIGSSRGAGKVEVGV